MNRIVLGILAGVTVTTAAVGAWKIQVAAQSRGAMAALDAQRAELRARVAALTQQQRANEEQAAAAESETPALKPELERARAAKGPAQAAVPLSGEEAERRIEAARHLAQVGDGEQALRELLWCLDNALPALDRNRRTRQARVVAEALVALGQRYPAAEAAARERWTKLRVKLLSAGDIDHALNDFATLSRALHEDEAIVTLYDQLPPGHSLRPFVGIRAFDDLVKRQRYRDAFGVRDFGNMSSRFEMNRQMTNLPNMLSYAVKSAATNIEVLAGAGETGLARELAQRVLKADGSAETARLLRTHLERAGQPQVLEGLWKGP